jgi:polyisoprenoid-binding protein YceI
MRYLFLLVLFISVHAEAQKFITEEGRVVFISKAPLSSFEGKSNHLRGLIDLEKNMLDFYLDLNTLKTGIGLRDRHMRENYLETEDFPFAEFTGKLLNPPPLIRNDNIPVRATGVFKIHGMEKEI